MYEKLKQLFRIFPNGRKSKFSVAPEMHRMLKSGRSETEEQVDEFRDPDALM